MTSYRDQDISAETSHVSIVALGCTVVRVTYGMPSVPSPVGMELWGMPCAAPAASSIPCRADLGCVMEAQGWVTRGQGRDAVLGVGPWCQWVQMCAFPELAAI